MGVDRTNGTIGAHAAPGEAARLELRVHHAQDGIDSYVAITPAQYAGAVSAARSSEADLAAYLGGQPAPVGGWWSARTTEQRHELWRAAAVAP